MLRAVIATLVLGVPAAHAALDCRGVLDYDTGKGHFHCRFDGDRLRRVRAVCRDGQLGCDADAACNDSCRFALCADRTCSETIGVDVPLRHRGRGKRRTVFRTADARFVLTCLRHRACPTTGPTITIPTPTTTTTLPAPNCTARLTGAVEADVPCMASLDPTVLGLPLFRLRFEGSEVSGGAAALLLRNTGDLRLGQGIIFMLVEEPLGRNFQGVREDASHHALLHIDSVEGRRIHGSLDATLPANLSAEVIGLHAEF